MSELRIVFEKRGAARYISHLDLMRVFRRAYLRAGIEIAYSKGFHPHQLMNILLPLPTGFESYCELLDFTPGTEIRPESLPAVLNPVLPPGIRITGAYTALTPARELRFAGYNIRADFRASAGEVADILAGESLVTLKRTKRGEAEVDIIKLTRRVEVAAQSGMVVIDALFPTGEDNLNPEYMVSALAGKLGEDVPFAAYTRREVYRDDLKVFK